MLSFRPPYRRHEVTPRKEFPVPFSLPMSKVFSLPILHFFPGHPHAEGYTPLGRREENLVTMSLPDIKQLQCKAVFHQPPATHRKGRTIAGGNGGGACRWFGFFAHKVIRVRRRASARCWASLLDRRIDEFDHLSAESGTGATFSHVAIEVRDLWRD